MGFNTTVLFLNDHLHELERTKDLGEKLSLLIRSGYVANSLKNLIPHVPGARVLDTCHSSNQHILHVGGNTGGYVGCIPEWSDDPEVILRQLARELGYDLKKRKKR